MLKNCLAILLWYFHVQSRGFASSRGMWPGGMGCLGAVKRKLPVFGKTLALNKPNKDTLLRDDESSWYPSGFSDWVKPNLHELLLELPPPEKLYFGIHFAARGTWVLTRVGIKRCEYDVMTSFLISPAFAKYRLLQCRSPTHSIQCA